MKKLIIPIVATMVVIVTFALAGAGMYFGESVDTTGKTKIVGQTFDLSKATGPVQVTMQGYSSKTIFRARTGSGTPYTTVTSCTSTSRTTHRVVITKPYKEGYVCYTALGKVGRYLYSDGAGF